MSGYIGEEGKEVDGKGYRVIFNDYSIIIVGCWIYFEGRLWWFGFEFMLWRGFVLSYFFWGRCWFCIRKF